MNFLKRIAPFEAALILVILGLHLYASTADVYAFPNNWFKRDDAYYYFKVAQNIAEGHGSAFDGINPTNGYHPLWMLVCIPIFALARFDLILPLRILLVVIALIQAATSILIYRLLKAHLSHAVAILAAVFWSFDLYIHDTVYKMGLETPIAAFSVILLVYQLAKFEHEWRAKPVPTSKLIALGLIAALALFSRLDLVFLAVVAGLWVIFRGTPMRHLLPLDIAVIFLSMTSSVLLRIGFQSYNTTYASSAIEAALIAIVIKIIALYFFGAYQHPRSSSVWRTLRQTLFAVAIATALSAGIYIFLSQMGSGGNFPLSAFFYDFGISLTLLCASRLTLAWFANPSRIHTESPLAQLKSNWKTWLREGAAFYGVLGGLLTAYMLFNLMAFGASSPVSGQIKRWWGSMGNSAYEFPAGSWNDYFGLGTGAFAVGQPFVELVWQGADLIRAYFLRGAEKDDARFLFILAMMITAFLLLILFNKRRARQAFANLAFIPLTAGSVIHVLSYSATAYGGAKEWYWVSQMILLTFASCLALDLLLKPLRKIRYLNIVLIAAALWYGVNSANLFRAFVAYAMPHGRYDANLPYMEVVAYIEANTFPGEIIGMTGGGNIGYFIEGRTIVNMDGLINSYEYFHILQRGEAPLYLRDQGMTVIFANPRLLALPPYYGQFAPYLERYSSFGGKDLLYLLEEPKY